MIKLVVLIAIIALLFVFLPPMPAAFWSLLPLVIMAGVFFDAMKRGRYVLARRRDDKMDGMDQASQMMAGVTIFHAVWLGLTAPGSAMPPGTHHGAGTGGDIGGFDGGGFDGTGGGGDAGGGGGGF